jgi:hypothetical protein
MSVLATGRPITRKGKKAARKRDQAQKWYANLSDEEKQAYVARRDKKAQRRANAKRDRKDRAKRNKYHRELTSAAHSAMKSGKLKKPAGDLQFHHTGAKGKRKGTKGVWLSARENNRRKPKKPGR